MLAVSNTSPISNLASISRVELLRSQFSAIWVPGAVAEELPAHPDPPAKNLIQRAIEEQWIKVGKVGDSRLLRLLLLQLHQGEAEAIAFATELKADMVLIDEQEGRQACFKNRPCCHRRSGNTLAGQTRRDAHRGEA
jgi:uncharacterized protein